MKILIVDDSALIRGILKESLDGDPAFKVAGVAANGESAVAMAAELNPDLIVMDVNMPVMDGIEATAKIMQSAPKPILIFSAAVDDGLCYRACQAGAVDVMPKPDIGQLNDPGFYQKLRNILLTIAESGLKGQGCCSEQKFNLPAAVTAVKPEFIVLGASTGGPRAVREVLAGLPGDLKVPVAMVQHLETGFDTGYVNWINEGTLLQVTLVREKTTPLPGHVYVAPCDRHLKLAGGSLVLDDGPRVVNQKPAVDVLFSSAAAFFRERLLGVLLTGMGRDGADGCKVITGNGGKTIAEDASTAAIFGMPKAALELRAVTYLLPLGSIPEMILKLLS